MNTQNCDVVVGSGAMGITAGAYKVTEGEKEVTRYKFGILFDLPKLAPELDAKFTLIGKKRVVSVIAAGKFNKANDYGTKEDAEEMASLLSTADGWASTLEKARREGGVARVDSTESLAIRILASVLKDKNEKGQLASAKTPVPRIDDPPKTEKGTINFNAWAKACREAEHPWYVVAKKQAEQKKGFE
jgi:hypothetical protein